LRFNFGYSSPKVVLIFEMEYFVHNLTAMSHKFSGIADLRFRLLRQEVNLLRTSSKSSA